MWIVAVAIIAGMVVLWFFFFSHAPGRNQTRRDFEHWARALLVAYENGSSMTFLHADSDLRFEYVRVRGAKDQATISLRFPCGSRSREELVTMVKLLESNGFEAKLGEDSKAGEILECLIQVDDIYKEWSGAKGARAAHLLLDTMSIPQDARFHLRLVGQPSRRDLDRAKGLRE